MNDSLIVVGLLALGAVHGLNPAMGWLFAVGMGLQQRDRRAVWHALGPLALGHALAIAAALLLAAAVGLALRPQWLEWLVAAALVGCGAVQLTGHVHPRWGGMRMSARDLTFWSFLMASAHGAGLMALPLVLNAAAPLATSVPHAHGTPIAGGHGDHVLAAGVESTRAMALGATIVHTLGYLAVTGILAVIVYEKLGLRLLRRAWINLNLFWGIALVVTGLLTLLL
jgi:hypothetical protein